MRMFILENQEKITLVADLIVISIEEKVEIDSSLHAFLDSNSHEK